MPRKVNVELEASLKLKEAERKKNASLDAIEKFYQEKLKILEQKKVAALEAVDLAYSSRLEKVEVWKAAQIAIEQEAKSRPRLSKEEKELQEAKERQKKMLEESRQRHEERKKAVAEGKPPEPTPREKERGSVFEAFASLQEESEAESEDMWDTSDMTPENRLRYLRSLLAEGNTPPEGYDLPEELREEKSEKSPPTQESEKPEVQDQQPSQPPILFQKSEKEEKSEKKEENVPPANTFVPSQFEDAKIISNTKVKKQPKTVGRR